MYEEQYEEQPMGDIVEEQYEEQPMDEYEPPKPKKNKTKKKIKQLLLFI